MVLGQSPSLFQIAKPVENANWMVFHKDIQLNPTRVFHNYPAAFGLGENDHMDLVKTEEDRLGHTHYRFQQYYKGVKVEWGEFWIHAHKHRADRANGFVQEGISMEVLPQLTTDMARTAAIKFVDAEQYMWEDAAAETTLQLSENDPQASFYPTPELLITGRDFDRESPDYVLAYLVDVYAAQPHSRLQVYVNAMTGDIIKSYDILETTNVEGTAETKYHGVRPLITDSTDTGYRLHASGFGQGIFTYDMNGSLNFDVATDFYDDDNYWDNVNPQQDEVATDVHWGAQMTHQYYQQHHQRNSVDDAGKPLISYVHYGQDYANAFWNGAWSAYGDAQNQNPFTCIDIVGHEFTHGLTSNTAQLAYINESGALNEAFSDIFGEAIAFSTNPSTGDWLIAAERGTPLRSFSNPNDYQGPDTYLGLHWESGTGDNGGVHTNSGVPNHWFYILSEGKTGVNDNGDAYSVSGIGIASAEAIAYRMLVHYLLSSSQFMDARMASIWAAQDLFGYCSNEVYETTQAWYAVGVGDTPPEANDIGVSFLSPLNSCGLTANEQLSIQIQNYGCTDIPAPLTLQVVCFVNGAPAAVEAVTLPNGLGATEIYDYTFTTPFNFSASGNYEVIARSLYPSDPNALNDSSNWVGVSTANPVGSEAYFDFESFAGGTSVLDSMYLVSRPQSLADIRPMVGVDSTYGILLEGGDPNFVYLYAGPVVDPYAYNEDYSAFACFCVKDDANLGQLILEFDLRQTLSLLPGTTSLGVELPPSSLLRVLVNETEVARYIADTLDTFDHHTVDLSDFIGQGDFTLCMEAKLWEQEQSFNPNHTPDRAYIDNVHFMGANVSIESPSPVSGVQLYPNPTHQHTQLAYTLSKQTTVRIQLLNTMGQILYEESNAQVTGRHERIFDLSAFAKGLYILSIETPEHRIHKQIVHK